MLKKYDFFWTTMELCDWKKEGDDDKVLKPVVEYLSKQEDSVIFEFDDFMTELLYNLDTEKLAEKLIRKCVTIHFCIPDASL